MDQIGFPRQDAMNQSPLESFPVKQPAMWKHAILKVGGIVQGDNQFRPTRRNIRVTSAVNDLGIGPVMLAYRISGKRPSRLLARRVSVKEVIRKFCPR